MSKSTSNIGLLELLSLYMDLISHLSSKANIIDIDLLDAVKQSPFIRRLILNDLV
jgi:predicted RNA-binding protein associated with RNAse of E/G family